MSRDKLVIFDLDGTLNRTDLYSVAAQQKALEEFGVTGIPEADLKGCLGGRPIDYAKRFLPHLTHEDHLRYLERELYWEKVIMEKSCGSFEGIPELLDRLHQAGYRTAVCSNSARDYIVPVLTALHLLDKIDAIQPLLPGLTKVDTLGLLLQREEPEAAVMVGDRIFDMEAARGNFIPFIGCLYGYCPAEMAGSDRTVDCAAAIFDAVQDLIGEPVKAAW